MFSIVSITFSQSDSTKRNFSAIISGGIAINDPINYYFFRETEYTLINPGFYGSIGLEYGPIDIVELTQLFLSISAGYSRVSTSEQQLENFPSTVNLIIETFPILIWAKLQTNTKLSPFVELGIGYSKLNFLETYSNEALNGASFNYWALAYSFGAGLNYKISQNFELALVVQKITNEKEKIEENDRYHKSGILIRNIVVPISLRIKIKL